MSFATTTLNSPLPELHTTPCIGRFCPGAARVCVAAHETGSGVEIVGSPEPSRDRDRFADRSIRRAADAKKGSYVRAVLVGTLWEESESFVPGHREPAPHGEPVV